MIKLLPLSLVLLALSTNTFAAPVTFSVIGEPSCGNWVKDRENVTRTKQAFETPNQSTADLIRTRLDKDTAESNMNYDIGWVQGFLSGLSVGPGRDYFNRHHPDSDSINLFIDKYCAQNPLNGLLGAGTALIGNLKK